VLVFFERVFQVFLETTVGQHLFETAPRGFSTFGSARLWSHTPVDLVEDAIVIGAVFGFGQELFVQIEAFVIPFGHRFFAKKTIRNSELHTRRACNEAANYSRFRPCFNCV
jgi:hypothetical protein